MTTPSTRERVLDLVAAEPGIHFNGVVRRLDITPGQAQYHLRRLARTDAVHPEPRYGRTHYFPPEVEEPERHAIAVLRRETARDVAMVVLVDGPLPPGAVASELGIARSTLEHHLDHLTAAGILRKRRDDAGRVTLHVPDPDALEHHLDVVTPTVTDRLVDRFQRLVDSI